MLAPCTAAPADRARRCACSSAASSPSRSTIACSRRGSEARISASGSNTPTVMSRRGQQIGDAMTHQAAADHADFLFVHVRLSMSACACLTVCMSICLWPPEAHFWNVRATQTLNNRTPNYWPIYIRRMVMPALMWVAFWSCMMGSAACWGEQPHSIRKKSSNHREQSSGGVAAIDIHHLPRAEI